MSDATAALIERNDSWAQRQRADAPSYFAELASGQSPPVCWVGCCDSRVAPGTICQCALGELFIQTNIANQVRAEDVNAISSLEYAINALGVEHLIICGHTSCGGVIASMADSTDGLPANVAEWIAPMRKLYQASKDKLPQEDDAARATEMSRINVRAQVRAAAQLDVVRGLRAQSKSLTIHGWLFHLDEGTIERLEKVEC